MISGWFRRKLPVETPAGAQLDRALREIDLWIRQQRWVTHEAIESIEQITEFHASYATSNREASTHEAGEIDSRSSHHPATDPVLAPIVASVCDWFGLPRDRFAASIVESIPSDSAVQVHVIDDGVVAVALQEETSAAPVQQWVGIAGAAVHAEWLDGLGRPPSPLEVDVRLVTAGLTSPAAEAAMTSATWSGLGYSGWQMARLGVLSPAEFGYVTARWKQIGGVIPKAAIQRMRLDTRSAFHQTLAFYKSIDPRQTLLECEALPANRSSVSERLAQLDSGDPGLAYQALKTWSGDDARLDPRVATASMGFLKHSDLNLRTAATRLVGRYQIPRDEAERILKDGLRHSNDAVFLAAIASAVDHQIPIDSFAKRLAGLAGISVDDQFITLELIRRAGPVGDGMIRQLAETWWMAYEKEDHEYADELWLTMAALESDPPAYLRKIWSGQRNFDVRIAAAGRQHQRYRERQAESLSDAAEGSGRQKDQAEKIRLQRVSVDRHSPDNPAKKSGESRL